VASLPKSKRGIKRLPDPHGDHALTVTDGQTRVGAVCRQGQEFFAFNINDKCLGCFDSAIEAARAIGARP
jgi:hypothetical protein